MRIAIIGAGMSGLSGAAALADHDHEVALFDKGRGPGGRMSTRRIEVDGRTWRFDHGAQYFTVRDAAFAAEVAGWERDGIVARWPAAGDDAWVGVPGMNAPVRAMAARHAVSWNTRIDAIVRVDDGWRLASDAVAVDPAAQFDAVIVAVPAEQAAPLLAPVHPAFSQAAARSHSAPCWTALIAFDEPIRTDVRTMRDAGPIGWAARDGSKPGRGDAETWVVQAGPEWSAAHLEAAPDTVAPALLRLLAERLELALPAPAYLSAHRWRYARSAPADNGALWDGALGIGVCGDWLTAPRVEAAWLSGRALADRII
jgi:renalase